MKYTKYNPLLNMVNHHRIITKRFVLYIGFKCNVRCQFCYYLKSLEEGTAQNFSLKSLKRKIKIARFLGKDEIDITGGEATVHKDFISLVEYCRELKFKKINVITNGQKFSRIEYLKKAVDAGLTEILFSIHSHDPQKHDSLTQVQGSWNRIISAVKNAHELGVKVRINSVINNQNYLETSDYLKFCSSLNPSSVNLIVFNPSEEIGKYKTSSKVRFNSYMAIGEEIKKALINYQDLFKVINVRYIPFCFLKGFEKNVRGYWQTIYEKEEWDPILHWAFRKNWISVLGASFLGILYSFTNTNLFFGKKNIYTLLCESFQHIRIRILHKKPSKCKQCSLRNICSGIPRKFYNYSKNIEVYPYLEGEKVINPMVYCESFTQKFYSVLKTLGHKNKV